MKKKILVIDDNKQSRMLAVDLLSYRGYEVVAAADGAQGIRMAKEERPDLIIMDIQMPDMDGFSALKMLKDDLETKEIKVIAITALAMKGDMEKVLDAGFDSYMSKPIDTRRLPELVKEILNLM